MAREKTNVSTDFQPLLHSIGFIPQRVFTDPRIIPWRKLPDRENCTMDVVRPDGQPVRLHVKRYQPQRGMTTPAQDEATALRALEVEKIPAPRLVAWGQLTDGRSFLIIEDLTGYEAADKLIEQGTPFNTLLHTTADLAARLHNAGLHHQDLYLCHFFARAGQGDPDVKLIDAARVRRFSYPWTRPRWIVKDLAQFWYSTTKLPISDNQRLDWLARYANGRGLKSIERLRRSILNKVRRIAAHDAKLNQRQPMRNISIPETK